MQILTIRPDRVQNESISSYYAGTHLDVKVEGYTGKIVLALADTPRGNVPIESRFAFVPDATGRILVPPSVLKHFVEGATLYYTLWEVIGSRKYVRYQGDVTKRPTIDFDQVVDLLIAVEAQSALEDFRDDVAKVEADAIRAEAARELTELYAGAVTFGTSISELGDPTAYGEGAGGVVIGTTDLNGIYFSEGGVWVHKGQSPLGLALEALKDHVLSRPSGAAGRKIGNLIVATTADYDAAVAQNPGATIFEVDSYA